MILHTRPIQLLTGKRERREPARASQFRVNFVKLDSMPRSIISPFWEVLEHARLGAGSPLEYTSVENHHFLTKMSFNVADAHCNINIHNCLDSGSSGGHALCEAPVGISVHNTLATKDPTLRTAKAVPGLQKSWKLV